ncbi:MAG: hypothetical protein AAF743_01255 [Planctomycetota bacterium]
MKDPTEKFHHFQHANFYLLIFLIFLVIQFTLDFFGGVFEKFKYYFPVIVFLGLSVLYRRYFWRLHSAECDCNGQWLAISTYDKDRTLSSNDKSDTKPDGDTEPEGDGKPEGDAKLAETAKKADSDANAANASVSDPDYLCCTISIDQTLDSMRLEHGAELPRAKRPHGSKDTRWYSSTMTAEWEESRVHMSYEVETDNGRKLSAVERIELSRSPHYRETIFSTFMLSLFWAESRRPNFMEGRFGHARGTGADVNELRFGKTVYIRVPKKWRAEFKELLDIYKDRDTSATEPKSSDANSNSDSDSDTERLTELLDKLFSPHRYIASDLESVFEVRPLVESCFVENGKGCSKPTDKTQPAAGDATEAAA